MNLYKKLLVCTALLIESAFFVCAQTKPLYTLPNLTKSKAEITDFLVGTDSGLYCIQSNNKALPLWTEGKVTQIARADKKWYIVSNKGIFSTTDLKTFKDCNSGLPFLTIKEYDGRQKSFVNQVQLLKDFCVDPLYPEIVVTATKDDVYLSRDGGSSWKNIGSMSSGTNGIKAVAVAHIKGELVVFMSHAIYGFSYCRIDSAKPVWTDVSAGFYIMPTVQQVDEISDIVPVVFRNADGTMRTEIYCAQTFVPYLYHFNFDTKRAETIHKGTNACDTYDGLCQSGNQLLFATPGNIMSYDLQRGGVTEFTSNEYIAWRQALYSPLSAPNTAYVPASMTGLTSDIILNELWLLRPDAVLSPWGDIANNRKAIYVATNYVISLKGINKFKGIIKENNLDTIVVDMKDDYGRLRFDPESPLIQKKGNVSAYKVDLDQFVSEFKKDNIYLVGRIVVFKDASLQKYEGGKYSVWDRVNNNRWVGIKGYEDVVDGSGNVTGKQVAYYDENWVDPYCEEVWEYNVEIAKELVRRGFDEIQFDYIRFPTDGTNLSNATFRWRDKGMDKESALTSFLAYARKNINAPIGVDIYGANGWYRSGTRTGQDVELMSDYVDVICPMYYPSHFEQDFLAYKPAEERTYRIYFYGSYRNTVIGRNRIIARPWIQAFYLPVRYDRNYYGDGKEYIQREVYGVRDGLDRGYMYWNNIGRYEDISPDPAADKKSPWYNNEGALQERLPAFSSGGVQENIKDAIERDTISAIQEHKNEMISIMDTVLEQGIEEAPVETKRNISPLSALLQVFMP